MCVPVSIVVMLPVATCLKSVWEPRSMISEDAHMPQSCTPGATRMAIASSATAWLYISRKQKPRFWPGRPWSFCVVMSRSSTPLTSPLHSSTFSGARRYPYIEKTFMTLWELFYEDGCNTIAVWAAINTLHARRESSRHCCDENSSRTGFATPFTIHKAAHSRSCYITRMQSSDFQCTAA